MSDRDVPWLIFDGDCAFCTSSASWVDDRLRRTDGHNVRLVPWQFTDLEALGTSAKRAQREVLLVTPDGEVFGGARAFAHWLQFSRKPFAILGYLMELPPIRQLGAVVYRLVANNRQRMPGGSPACALPPPGFDPSQPGTKAL